MHTLHLTEAEAKKFSVLSADLQKGVAVEKETLTYEDSPRRRGMRFELLTIKDPELVALGQAVQTAKSDADFQKAVGSLDLSKIGNADFMQMLFAMGPDAIGHIIDSLLSGTPSAKDVEAATAYSMLRHDMLESLHHYSPKEP